MVQTSSNLSGLLPTRTLRAAIYVRISSKKQEEGYSKEFQREQCIARCIDQGYLVDEDKHLFAETHTGTEYRERPILSAMRQAAYNHEFDVLVVYKLDRLARNRTHLAIIREDLHYHGIVIESITNAVIQFTRNSYTLQLDDKEETMIPLSKQSEKELQALLGY